MITVSSIVLTHFIIRYDSVSSVVTSTKTAATTEKTTNKGVTVEVKGSTANASTSKVTTTKQVTSEPVTEHLQQTTERVESKVIGVSDTHVVVPSYNAGHTGMFD